ncbi:MAG: carbohydrate binding domain-containing protein [Bryobacteraceae bacterium]
MFRKSKLVPAALCLLAVGALGAQSNPPAVLQIKAGEVAAHVSPMLYGLMTEEINYSYDGGLYGELLRNRNFKEDAQNPVHWQLVQESGGSGSMALDAGQGLNEAIPASLKLTIVSAGGRQQVGVANEGFWGIPVRPTSRYRASFYAKAAPGFNGPLTVAVTSNDGATTQASARVAGLTGDWKKYQVTLSTGKVAASAERRLVISTNHAAPCGWASCRCFRRHTPTGPTATARTSCNCWPHFSS